MAIVTALFLVIYLAFLYWFISRVYLPRYWEPVASSSRASPYRLALAVRKILDALHAFAFVAVIAWLPLALIMAASAHGNPGWGAAMDVFSGFNIDLSRLPGVDISGLRNPVIHGKTALHIETFDAAQWLLFSLSQEARGIVVVYLILQLRNIFAALCNGEAFAAVNARRLKKIGVVILLSYSVAPLWQVFIWNSVIDGIEINSQAFMLYPAFAINLRALLAGAAVLVFAGVMNEAVQMREEQRLTV